MRPRILLVEDEPHIAQGLVFNLEEEGYSVVHAASGEEALRLAAEDGFAMVVLDLMLPGMDGLEVCRRLRRHDPRLPILMLTARSGEQERIQGLAEGADDYLTKPFNLEEFLLRFKGMLRRSEWYRPEGGVGPYRFGRCEVELRESRATTPHGTITLTDQEVRLLRIFFQREGEVVSRTELLSAGWGMAPDAETRTLDNFVVRLRKYFEVNPATPVHFLTVRGRGYKFVRGGE